jgi:hypothetical protein
VAKVLLEFDDQQLAVAVVAGEIMELSNDNKRS